MKRRNMTLALAGCLLAAGIAVVILLLASSGGGMPKVPDVVGLTFKEAKKRVESAELTIEPSPEQDVSKVKDLAGREVVEQDPTEGEEAEEGTLVTVSLKGVPDKNVVEKETVDSAPAQPGDSQSTQPPPPPSPAPPAPAAPPVLVAPLDGSPAYPFTRDASVSCGHWEGNSQDYPYFGAPRDGNSRTHAGIDIYPPGGEGAPVKAMKDGTVIKVAPFYTRASGEVTYAVLVDHGNFVANYAELTPPAFSAGAAVKQGQVIGAVSGTRQLHFEKYSAGTREWTRGWYGDRPANLLDPTQMMLEVGLAGR